MYVCLTQISTFLPTQNSSKSNIHTQTFMKMELLQKPDEGVDYEHNTQRHHCTIISKIRNFSNECIHRPGEISQDSVDYDMQSQYQTFQFPVTVYANGSNKMNKGHVSVIFRGYQLNIKEFEFNCFVSVIDVTGKKKFTQSFKYSCQVEQLPPSAEEYWPTFGIDKYILRKTLISDATELLSNDILTLHIDIVVVQKLEMRRSDYSELVIPSFETVAHPDGLKYYLSLDSIVAKGLRFQSSYFAALWGIPMLESETRRMSVPANEYGSFLLIGSIVIGATLLIVESVNDIYQLFVVADKYDIPLVTGTCILLLKAYISLDRSADLLKIADEFYGGFDYLKDTVKSLLTSDEEEIEALKDMKELGALYKWCCEAISKESKQFLLFRVEESLSRGAVSNAPASEEPKFDFYL